MPDDIVTTLRRTAATHDPHVRAAVELLAEHSPPLRQVPVPPPGGRKGGSDDAPDH